MAASERAPGLVPRVSFCQLPLKVQVSCCTVPELKIPPKSTSFPRDESYTIIASERADTVEAGRSFDQLVPLKAQVSPRVLSLVSRPPKRITSWRAAS